MKFFYKYTVNIGDINYGNHFGNDKSLLLFHNARVNFFRELGVSELNIGNNIGIILSEAFVKFHKEIFLHDNLIVNVSVSNIKRNSFIIKYEVYRESIVTLSGYTKIIAFDYNNKKVTPLPEKFNDELKVYENKDS